MIERSPECPRRQAIGSWCLAASKRPQGTLARATPAPESDVGRVGWSSYAPAAAVHRMVAAILDDRHEILPCSAFLRGQYDIDGLFVGVPVRLGRRGIEQVVEIDLTPTQSAALAASAAAVRELVDKLELERALA